MGYEDLVDLGIKQYAVGAESLGAAGWVINAPGPEEDHCAEQRTPWVPETLSPYATWVRSRIRPPSRSRRRTWTFAPRAGGC
jgi:hypothetical protein